MLNKKLKNIFYIATPIILTVTTSYGQTVNISNGTTVEVPGPLYPSSNYITNDNDVAGYGFRSVNGSTIIGNDVSITTNGARAVGLYASSGAAPALIRMNGGHITTTNLGGDGSMSSYGAFANGAGGWIELQGTSLTTAGNRAYGIYVVNSTHSYFDSTSVLTTGSNAYAIRTAGLGVSNVGQGSNLETHGDGATGVYAVSGGRINIADSKVVTYGDSAGAIGASADASPKGAFVDASNVNIETYGSKASGVTAFQKGSTVSIINSDIHTRGSNSYGIYALNTGIVESNGLKVVTDGASSAGVKVFGSYTDQQETIANISNSTVETNGINSFGLSVTNKGIANLNNVEVITNGATSHGVSADLGGTLNLTNAYVRTLSSDASGIAGLTTTGQINKINIVNSKIDAAGDGYLSLNSLNEVTLKNTALISRNGIAMNFGKNSNTNFIADSSVTTGSVLTSTDAVSNVSFRNGAVWFMTGNSNLTTLAFDAGVLIYSAIAELNVTNPIILDAGGGTFDTNGFNNILKAPLIGSGSFTKVGTGRLTISSANSYHGDTTVASGNLQAGGGDVFSPNSNYIVKNEGVLDLNGFDQTLASLKNEGLINFGSSPGTRLNIIDKYFGYGGKIVFNTVLNGDDSTTDRLVINGNTSGISYVKVNNAGGSGAKTVNGIELITVKGDSAGSFVQAGRIVAGSYDYFLGRGNGDNSKNWYLTNEFIPEEPSPEEPSPEEPSPERPSQKAVIRPEAGVYAVNLYQANNLFNLRLHDRLGETQYTDIMTGEQKVTSMWLRNLGGHTEMTAGNGQLKNTGNRYVLQLGGDLAQWSSNGDDRYHLGMMAGYGHVKNNTYNHLTGYRATGSVDGHSTGLYGTYYSNEADKTGLYIDSWLQYNWFKNTVKGEGLAEEKYHSEGVTASVESGYSFLLNETSDSNGNTKTKWYVQPKAQLTYDGIKMDSHTEQNGTRVSGRGENNIQTRLGVKMFGQGHAEKDNGSARIFQPFAEVNWLHNTRNTGVSMDGNTVNISGTRDLAELKMGLEGRLNKNTDIWLNVAQQLGSDHYSDTQGMVGMKVRF